MMGRLVAGHEERLNNGSHSFTFHAGNQKTYLLIVTSSKQIEKQIMVQVGSGDGTSSKLEYNGHAYQQETMILDQLSGLKSSYKSDFIFEIGDELRFTGYFTDTQNNVLSKEITDTPEESTDYVFEINNTPPDVQNIYGNAAVYANESELVYAVDAIEGTSIQLVYPTRVDHS